MQQLSIFDYPGDSKNEAIKLHDKVKLKLLDESIDWEIHNYRKYYCDHLIGKVGIVLEVNKNTVVIQFAEETVICDVSELEWIA
ncbi:hypothetical protein [Lysinibacillus parviboronicapiens]|uniref:hypothetical protein n=1 Tax=Lysinibacillus parviboronicapiens TaxID=436516 RepID=UPI000D38E145|nr:hypothetical protein [Lysinibacillus parviboronicapiens]